MSDHYDRYNGMENLLGTNLAEVGTDCSEFPNNSDAISRQAAIDAIRDMQAFEDDNGQPYLYLCDVMAVFTDEEELPPIQPKRGKWIDLHIKEEVYGEMYRCSVCGDFDFGGCFCPNCGADMRSDDMREVTT